MKIVESNLQLLNVDYKILYGTKEEGNAYFKETYDIKEPMCIKDGSTINLTAKETGEVNLFIWLSPHKDKAMMAGLIAHEATHLAKDIIINAGLDYDFAKNDELLAIVIGYIVGWVHLSISKIQKKRK